MYSVAKYGTGKASQGQLVLGVSVFIALCYLDRAAVKFTIGRGTNLQKD